MRAKAGRSNLSTMCSTCAEFSLSTLADINLPLFFSNFCPGWKTSDSGWGSNIMQKICREELGQNLSKFDSESPQTRFTLHSLCLLLESVNSCAERDLDLHPAWFTSIWVSFFAGAKALWNVASALAKSIHWRLSARLSFTISPLTL